MYEERLAEFSRERLDGRPIPDDLRTMLVALGRPYRLPSTPHGNPMDHSAFRPLRFTAYFYLRNVAVSRK